MSEETNGHDERHEGVEATPGEGHEERHEGVETPAEEKTEETPADAPVEDADKKDE